MPRRRAPAIELMDGERSALTALARRRCTAQGLALRARVVLRCAEGLTNQAVAKALGVEAHTVGKWRERFARERLEGLRDEPRAGAPRRIDDETIAELIIQTLEAAPPSGTHWSTRAMAGAMGLSRATVNRVWRAFGLQPHHAETFELSHDPEFIKKARDIVGLYVSPHDRALVLCVDAKAELQAIECTRPMMPMQPCRPERRASDNIRHGTSSLLTALDMAVGRTIGRCRRHRTTEFRDFLDATDAAIPAGLDAHVIVDNSSIHKIRVIGDWFAERARFRLDFTPTSAAWLDQVERFFALFIARQLRRGAHYSIDELEQAIRRYIDHHGASPKPFRWTSRRATASPTSPAPARTLRDASPIEVNFRDAKIEQEHSN